MGSAASTSVKSLGGDEGGRERGADYSSADRGTRHLVVPADAAGARLDQALARMLPEHSRSRLAGWLRAGHIRVDGRSGEPKQKVRGGETVTLAAAASAPDETHQPEPIDLAIRHEDDDILVIDKPVGLVVHPGSGNRTGTLLNALLHHAPALAALPRAGIVHRLDKDTSGLLVVAKTLTAQTHLVRQLQERSVERVYTAVARGDLAADTVIDAPIGRHPVDRTRMAVVARGRPARTHVRVLERFRRATLVECRLETGRTHQIRVHLASIGHALLGDPVYGARRATRDAMADGIERQALHARKLGLVHPRTARRRSWTSPLPADLATLIDLLTAGAERP